MVLSSLQADVYELDLCSNSEPPNSVDKSSIFSDQLLEFSPENFDLWIFNDCWNTDSLLGRLGLSEESLGVLVDDVVSAFEFADSALQIEVFFLDSAESDRSDAADLGSEGSDFLGVSGGLALESLSFALVSSDLSFDLRVFDLE